MKLLKIFLIIALLLTITASVSATVHFYNGNKYMELSENDKLSYVTGLIDMAYALTECFQPEICQKMVEATKGMTLGQLVKILDKYLEENPEKLHNPTSVTFFRAIDEIIWNK